MENFKIENNNENQKPKITLDSRIIQSCLAGRFVEKGVEQLTKIHAIINQLIKQGVSNSKEAGVIILDLFKEFEIEYFEPEDIFTKEVLNQIYESKQSISLVFEINDKPIIITSDSTVDSIMEKFNEPKEIKESKNTEALEGHQEAADKLLAQLETLDFNYQEELMNWLCDYNEHIDYSGVISDKEAVLKKFNSHGFSKKDNDIVDFAIGEALKDKDRYGKSLIGYMLENLGHFRSSIVRNWISNKI
jgi:hypothetical protein